MRAAYSRIASPPLYQAVQSLDAAQALPTPTFVAPSFSYPSSPTRPSFSAPVCAQLQQLRFIREEQINAGGDAVADLFEASMSKASRKRPEGPQLTTARKESLHLYREILRYSNLFVWKDKEGRPFREQIRTSTRKEFEDARYEPDPEIINRLIITGRDCVARTVESFQKRRQQIIAEEQAEVDKGAPGRF
eukprot:gene24683-10313_t